MAGIFINTDALTFFNGDKMNAEGVREDIDFYTLCGGVEAIFFNMNFQRCLWRSHSREAIWDGVEETPDGQFLFRGESLRDQKPEPAMLRFVRNAKRFSENCPDFFEIRYAYCHEKGVEMWHSMRMNDVHWTPDPDLPQHSGLWQTRHDLWRCHYRRPYTGYWENMGLDYLKEEVRDYQLALVREYLEHECDGLELDWMRSLPLFRPGMEEIGTDILTEFVRDIRTEADKAAKKFGHRVRIAVRVPRGPLETYRMGMDVTTWAREGLVDIVIPSPPHCANNATHMPLDLWRKLLPSETLLAPCIEYATLSLPFNGPRIRADEEIDAGFASSFYHRGADTIYLYNHFRWNGGFADREAMQRAFGYLGDQGAVDAKARRHITSFSDTENHCEGGRTIVDLPDEAWGKSVVAFPIDAGGATKGRKAKVIIGGDKAFHAEIRLNGLVCPGLPPDTPLPTMPTVSKTEFHVSAFEIPDGVLHDGRNTIDIINLDEEGFHPLWAEIAVEKA